MSTIKSSGGGIRSISDALAVLDLAFPRLGAGIKGVGTAINSTSGFANKFIAGAKAGFSGLWSIIQAHPILSVTAALAGLVALVQYANKEYNKHNEQLRDSVSSYEDSKKQVESLNDELSTTQERIDELNAKEHLTLVEQEELDRLKDANDQLLLQIQHEEELAAIKQRQAASDAVTAYNRNFGSGINDETVSGARRMLQEGMELGVQTSWENIPIRSLTTPAQLLGYREVIQELQDGTEQGSQAWNDYQDILDDVDAKIMDTSEDSKGILALLEEEKEAIELMPESQRTAEQQATLDAINADIEYIWKQINPSRWEQIQLDDIFNRDEFKDVKSELVDIAKEMNGLDKTTLSDERFRPFVEACEEAGISVEDLIAEINSLAGVEIFDYDELRKQARTAMEIAFLGEGEYDDQAKAAFDDFINGLTNEQLELVLQTRLSTDTSGWTEEQWLELLNAHIEVPIEIDPNSLNIDTETDGLEAVTTALSESISVTGLQGESIAALKERYQDLDNFDAARLFEKTASGVKLNTESMRELEEAYRRTKKEQAMSQLDDLIKQYEELDEAIQNTTDQRQRASLIDQRTGLQQQISDTSQLISQYDGLTSAFKRWQDAQSGPKNRDTYEGVIDGFESVDDLLSRGWVDDEVRAFVDALSFKDLSTASYDEVLAAWEELGQTIEGTSFSVKDFFTQNEEGESTTQGIFNFFDAVREKLGETYAWIDEQGGYHFNFGADDTEVAEALGIDIETLQHILEAARDAGFDIDLTSAIDSVDTLGSSFEQMGRAANNALMEIGATDIAFNFDTSDISDLDRQIQQAQDIYNSMLDEDGEIKVGFNESDLDNAITVISTLVAKKQSLDEAAVLKVDVSQADGEIAEVIAKLQAFKQAQNNYDAAVAVGADTTQAEADVQAALDDIANSDAEILATLNIDPTTAETALESINDLDLETIVSFVPDATLVDEYTSVTQPGQGVITWRNYTAAVDIYSKREKSGKGVVVWRNNTHDVDVYEAPTKYGKIVYRATTEGTSSTTASNTSKNKSSVAQGTAYAKGSGNWGIPNSGVGLGGEVGPEIRVRDGRWELIGADSAEFFNYERGDIIFNAEQTRQILKNGKIANGYKRGVVYAQGSAFSSGSGPGQHVVPGYSSLGDKSGSSSSSNKSSSSSTKSSGSSSKDTEDTIEKIDWIEIAIDRLERAISRLDITAQSTFKNLSRRTNAAYDEMRAIAQEIELQNAAMERYYAEAESIGLSEDIAKLIREGTIDINEYDEDTRDLIDQYQEWYEKMLDCSDALGELHENLAQLYDDNFTNIQTKFDNDISLLEHLTNTFNTGIDALEARGYLESKVYYEALSDVEEQKIKTLNEQYAELFRAFSEAMNSGEIEEGSESWYAMQQAMNEVKEAIDESNLSLLEFEKTMREIDWSYFDYGQERITQLTQEADFLIDLMSNKQLYDDRGQFTGEGNSSMGLHALNYDVYMAQADMYAQEMQKILKEMAEDPYNTDLIARREELLKLQQDSILAAEQEKDAIRDMVEEGIDLEIDALKELVDKYEDSLDAAKDLYDYEKKVRDQTSELSSLQKQLRAYTGDDSEEAKARIQKLQVEIKEAQENLEETEYDQYISDQKKLLDDLVEEYELTLNMRLDNIDFLIEDMIAQANVSAGEINSTLWDVSNAVGYTMTDQMTVIWGTATEALRGYLEQHGLSLQDAINQGLTVLDSTLSMYGDGFLDNMTSVNAVIGTIDVDINNLATATGEKLGELGDTFTSWGTKFTGEISPKLQSILDLVRSLANAANTQAQQVVDSPDVAPSVSPDTSVTPPTSTTTTPTEPAPTTSTSTQTKPALKVGSYVQLKPNTKWYYSSDGQSPIGYADTWLKGRKAKISRVNNASWATHPYAIEDYGWVKKTDIVGYATGGLAKKTGPAWLDGTPQKPEIVLSPSDSQNFLALKDAMAAAVKRGFDITPSANVQDISAMVARAQAAGGQTNSVEIGDTSIQIDIDHVEDYNDFINQMVADKQFERFIQTITLGKMMGKSSLEKNKFKW